MNLKRIFLIAAAAGSVALTGCAARSEYYGVYVTEGTDHRTSSYTSDTGTYNPVETEDNAVHVGNSPEMTEEAPETTAPTSTPSSTVPIDSMTSEPTPTDSATSESAPETSPQTSEVLPESTPASSTAASAPQTAPKPQTTTSAPQTPAPATKPSAPATQSTPATPSAPAVPSTTDAPKTPAPSTNPINPATAPETPASSKKTDTTTTATVAAAVDEPAPADDYITEVVRLVNAERAKEGLSPLALDNELSKAAKVRAEEQIELFGHTRPDGRSCFSVLGDYEINYRKAGENAAAGYYKPEDAVKAWMSSDGHRANILKSNYDKIGIGFVYSDDSYGVYWVQLFIDE